jgi:cytochrome c
MKLLNWTAPLVLAAGMAQADAHVTGDAEAGEGVFAKCKACHMIENAEGETIVKGGRTGPNLYGVFQRQAGTIESYENKYGDSLVEAGEAGLVWEEAPFVAYVLDPRGYLREYLDDPRARSKMSFKLRDEQDAKYVWAYLVSVGPEPDLSMDAESSD